MIYWLTASGGSSARLYWKSFNTPNTDPFDLPVRVSRFPHDIIKPTRGWAARQYTNIVFWREHETGGHFAAMEKPDALTRDIRDCFGKIWPVRRQFLYHQFLYRQFFASRFLSPFFGSGPFTALKMRSFAVSQVWRAAMFQAKTAPISFSRVITSTGTMVWRNSSFSRCATSRRMVSSATSRQF